MQTSLTNFESDTPALAADSDISACSSEERYTVMRGFFEGILSPEFFRVLALSGQRPRISLFNPPQGRA